MQILKKILIAVVALIVLALVAALFVNKEYAVQREITINKPRSEVYNYLKLLRNQDEFSVWATRDPNMKKGFRGTDGSVGFVSYWDSESDDVGAGEQEIMGMTEGERIDYELRFFRPFEATDNAYLITETISENETKVKWGFDGKMEYPMNLMLLFMDMEEMLGGDLQTGLDRLKVNLEQ